MAENAPVSAKTVLVVDAGHGAGKALMPLLAAREFRIVAWTPGAKEAQAEDADGFEWITDRDIDTLNSDLLGSLEAVIFNASALDEPVLMESGRLADAIAADGAFFMRTLQVVSRAMLEKGRGQIWAIAPDDSFAYYMPLPSAPITHHTRVGAIRALAKELTRFGVYANAAVLQPDREMTDPAAWQMARAGIGSYAQKFRPVSLASIADTFAHWLSRETLPFSGSVIHFGNGVYDGNF